MPELAVESVMVRFGGLQALDDVSLRVAPGAVTGLIGPNGAGKTTLFDVVTGLRRPQGGRVLLDGDDVTSLAPHQRARRGIARTFQRLELFGTLSALENVQLAAEARRRHGATAVAEELLGRVGLAGREGEAADLLPTGQARLLELARALATAPSVLLLDEPSAGLDEAESKALGGVLSGLAAEGLAVLLVEHDVSLVMELCHHVVVLDAGVVIARGTPEAVRADPVVQHAYLGAPADALGASTGPGMPAPSPGVPARPARPAPGGAVPALELRGVRAGYGRIEVLHGVDLAVAPGSVTALLGPNGAGKSTLVGVVSGRLTPFAGTVHLDGAEVTSTSPEARVRRGVCTLPEGRSVFPNLTVAEHMRLFAAASGPEPVARDIFEGRAYERFPVLGRRRGQLAGRMSGGEQQMLGLARALGRRPRLLVLDELSMGLAPLVAAQLFEAVAALAADEAVAVVLVEQFAAAALAVADVAAVMAGGRVVATADPGSIGGSVADVYLGAAAPPGPVAGPS